MIPKPNRTIAAHWLLFLYCLTITLISSAQPFKGGKLTEPYAIFKNSQKNASPSILSQTSFQATAARNINNDYTSACRTSTFYLHLPAPAGQKISLQKLQTLPDGNFVAAGSLISANNEPEGLIVKMTNAGVILSQQKVRINGNPSAISSIKVTLTGEIVIAGTVDNGTNLAFIAQLRSDLSINRVQTIALPDVSQKVTLNLLGTDAIALGVQLSSSVIYSTFTISGAIKWSYELPVNGLKELISFSNQNYGSFGLVVNCIENNKSLVKLIEVSNQDGSVTSSSTIGSGIEENKCMDVTFFNVRLHMLNIKKSASGFQLARNMMYYTKEAEVQQDYTLPYKMDFNVTAAIDNAGDAMGLCLPEEGKFVFIKQFPESYASIDFSHQYTVPKGSKITAVTRSLQDGGYLFSFNSADEKESFLIKTDSIGALPGCGYNDISILPDEVFNVPNTPLSISNRQFFPSLSSAIALLSDAVVTPQFSCNQTYCPAPPVEDSCLSTYLKILRSNSFIDFFTGHYLMRNNNQIALTMRYDRVLGGWQSNSGRIKTL